MQSRYEEARLAGSFRHGQQDGQSCRPGRDGALPPPTGYHNTRPSYLRFEEDAVPNWMKRVDRWVLWKAEERGGRWTKVPYSVNTGRRADVTDALTWASFEDVLESYMAFQNDYDGMGFVLGDGYAGIDLDHAVKDGMLDPAAGDILDEFDGCYREKSPSGDGYHIVFRTDYDIPGHESRRGNVEFYTEKRYLTITGHMLESDAPDKEFVPACDVAKFHDAHLARGDETRITKCAIGLHGYNEAESAEDEELLRTMFCKFLGSKDLYEGAVDKYGGDHSRADLALAGYLVKVCHGSLERADALFRGSGLMRPKWDEPRGGRTYGQMTLEKALGGYDGSKAPNLKGPGAPPALLDDLVGFFGESKLEQLGINDKQMSRLFAQNFRDVLAYVPEKGSLYAYDGIRWVKHGANEVAQLYAKHFIDAAYMYCTGISTGSVREECIKQLNAYQRFRGRESLIRDAECELVRHLSDFDREPRLLNVLNATIDFRGKPVVREHDPADLLTQVAPVTYDPDAGCDLFLKTLNECCEGDADLADYIQKVYGKVVAGDISDDQAFFFGESPRTGKDTVTGPLVEMLGSGEGGYAKNAQPETFAVRKERNPSASSGDRARLKDCKLVITSEPPRGMELDAGLFKEMSGDGLVTARFNYQDDIQFRMRGILFMLANCFPAVNDPSVFGSGRVKVIPFDRIIPEDERDRTLRGRLREPDELSGLLNWCIEGYLKSLSEGFEPPDSVVEATRSYERRWDVVAAYIEERLIPCDGAKLRAQDVFDDFCQWGKGSGITLGRREFYSRLRQHVVVRGKAFIDGKEVRSVVEGFRLRSVD